MVVAADILAGGIIDKRLADLHGLADEDLHRCITHALNEIPPDRGECVEACIGALRAAFAEFRARQIEEFQGEKALICTCFGISEETIGSLLSKLGATGLVTVEEITDATQAGGGCGSCRMLIQEMIDGHAGHD